MKILFFLFLAQVAGTAMCIQRFPSHESTTLGGMTEVAAHDERAVATQAIQAAKASHRVQTIQIQHNPIVKTTETAKAAPRSPGFFESLLPSAAKGQIALQVSQDHSDIDDIIAVLQPILDDLLAADNEDALLLTYKTGNHTAAIAATAAANASLAAANTFLTSQEAIHASKLTQLASETSAANNDIALCLSELTYASTMQTALDDLKAISAGPLIAIGHSSQQQLIAMANKLSSSARPQYKDSLALIQRDYAASTDVQGGIDQIIVQITAQKTTAEQRIVTAQAEVTAAAADVQTASDDVVLKETRQAAAMVTEYAALVDKLTTTADVALSTAATQQVRDAVLAIQADLESLRNVAATDTNFLQVGHKLGAGTASITAAKASIQNILLQIFNTIDAEEMAESSSKINKMMEWNALKAAQVPLIEDSNIKDEHLTTLDTNIASALGVLDSANAALAAENEAQARETVFFGQLSTLINDLDPAAVEGGQVLLQTQRGHTDFIAQFNSLMTSIQAEMLTAKNAMIATRDADQTAHATLVNSRVAVALDAEQAEIAEQNAIAATDASQQVYLTASQRYMNNGVLRNQERTILMNLQVLVNNL